MTGARHNTLHYVNCLQGLQFGMNRVLHVSAKKKRRFTAAGLANRSQMGFLACRPSCWVPPTQGHARSRPGLPGWFLLVPACWDRTADVELQTSCYRPLTCRVWWHCQACVRLLTHRYCGRAGGNQAPDQTKVVLLGFWNVLALS